jgi:AcrR family transcriptional regulator
LARPRSEEARRKTLTTVVELIVERGVASLSIEEVAARSGVAKTTIYRRWPERASLIIDAVRTTFEHIGIPDTGSLRGDLDEYFGGVIRADLTGPAGKIMPCIIDAASRDPEIETLLHRIGVERQQPILTIVARAQGRGELPDELDPVIVFGTIVGPIVFRKVVQRQPIDAGYVSACLDVAIAGLRASRSPVAAGAPSRAGAGVQRTDPVA